MKKQLGSTDIFFPIPAVLIVSGSLEEPNVSTIAWVGMVSSTPPTIGISMDKRRYSLELIRQTKEFTVNIPSSKNFKETDFCGLVSGREQNKFNKASLTPVRGTQLKTPIIDECPFNLECRLVQEIELGDYILLLGEVVETHIDQDKVTFNNNRVQIDIGKTDPLVYCATVREYWCLGSKLGDAFKSGIDILNR